MKKIKGLCTLAAQAIQALYWCYDTHLWEGSINLVYDSKINVVKSMQAMQLLGLELDGISSGEIRKGWHVEQAKRDAEEMEEAYQAALVVFETLKAEADQEPDLTEKEAQVIALGYQFLLEQEENMQALKDANMKAQEDWEKEHKSKSVPAGTEQKRLGFSLEKTDQGVRFKSTFTPVQKNIDTSRGIAMGIVLPVGTPERTYLDGEWFNASIIEAAFYDAMFNKRLMVNKDHDPDDLTPLLDHPDFAVLEIWLCKCDFELNGEQFKRGDLCATIMARTPEFKAGLKDGTYNGFSIEGWATYEDPKYTVKG